MFPDCHLDLDTKTATGRKQREKDKAVMSEMRRKRPNAIVRLSLS
jgi:hypothetical protein